MSRQIKDKTRSCKDSPQRIAACRPQQINCSASKEGSFAKTAKLRQQQYNKQCRQTAATCHYLRKQKNKAKCQQDEGQGDKLSLLGVYVWLDIAALGSRQYSIIKMWPMGRGLCSSKPELRAAQAAQPAHSPSALPLSSIKWAAHAHNYKRIRNFGGSSRPEVRRTCT